MTFEEEVREALAKALHADTRVRDGYSKHFAIVILAPLVTAALEQAVSGAFQGINGSPHENWQDEALSELGRGTSGETPLQ